MGPGGVYETRGDSDIDLPGPRMIGTFITTLVLPQINPINEEMREHLEVMFSNSAGRAQS